MIDNKKQVLRAGANTLVFLPRLLLALAMLPLPAWAELKHELELGVGVGMVNFPIYRGAEDRRSYILPIPYFDYNGDKLQINRDRLRSRLFRSDRIELDISVSGSVPVNSSDTTARKGMDDIDAILEVGPLLNVHLYYDERKQTNLDLRLPVRAVLPVRPYRIDHQGWIFQPALNLDLRNVWQSGWNMGLQAALVYGDQGYTQYFYNVAPQFATATRPAYSTTGGYGGSQFTTALSRRKSGMWMGGFLRWDNLSGAVFEDSPLVTRKQAFSLGFAVSWILYSSEKMVEVSND
jgi:outer membrane scaffolding protein for murein synthesis (MipA/OmpV family)